MALKDKWCRDSYAFQFNNARKSSQLKEAITSFHAHEFFALRNELVKSNRLAKVLNFQSGDSWNGTHFRNIEVAVHGNMVGVINEYSGHIVGHAFTKAALAELAADDVTQYTSYYSDFVYQAEKAGLALKP